MGINYVESASTNMSDAVRFAPGWPGIPGRWTSSAKTGVGTSASSESRVWFTLSHGILNEVYFPGVDRACIRDLGFIVSDGVSFVSEEKRDAHATTSQVPPGVPAYVIHTSDAGGRYRIEKEVLADPRRDVVLQRIRFVPLQGTLADFRLYAQTVKRYLVDRTICDRVSWRFNNKVRTMPAGTGLRIETLVAADIRWTLDGWRTAETSATRDTTLGVHLLDLPTRELRPGDAIIFTFYWPGANRWEGVNFSVLVDGARP
jgi:hypothetical protein